MNNKVKIMVISAAGAGKLCMAIIIEQALIQAGFSNLKIFDIDISDAKRESVKTQNLDFWKEHTDVIIETAQLPRQLPND